MPDSGLEEVHLDHLQAQEENTHRWKELPHHLACCDDSHIRYTLEEWYRLWCDDIHFDLICRSLRYLLIPIWCTFCIHFLHTLNISALCLCLPLLPASSRGLITGYCDGGTWWGPRWCLILHHSVDTCDTVTLLSFLESQTIPPQTHRYSLFVWWYNPPSQVLSGHSLIF